jgi:hypothetical protein
MDIEGKGCRVWTEFIWLRIQKSGRLLCTWLRTSGFNMRWKFLDWLRDFSISERIPSHGTNICGIRIAYGTAVEDSILPGHAAVSNEWFQTLWRIIQPAWIAYLRMRSWSFTTLETMHLSEQYHIPGVRNLQVSFSCVMLHVSLQIHYVVLFIFFLGGGGTENSDSIHKSKQTTLRPVFALVYFAKSINVYCCIETQAK